MPRAYLPVELRFWAKVDKNGPVPAHATELGPCWVWTSNTNPKGYGRFLLKYRNILPHRYTFELFKGAIPDGLQIDHLCRNKLCVNPEHLEAVTGLVNQRRGHAFRKQQTHCKRGGHPLSGDNLKIGAEGRRVCRKCNYEKNRECADRIRQSHYAKGLTWDGKPRKTRRLPPLLRPLVG